MVSGRDERLIRFLREELAVSAASIEMALRREDSGQGPLPIVLWRYGLISLDELDRVFAWLDTVDATG
ncbi:MAG: DUF2949 domain-containing protein [Gloeomargarita sp. SKYBB_i_bin120]|nr:DUF2949 domain-containing protein [Gloeomargarita sp. SKYG98]MCS7293637.1 DUF2949 domain-containing protein [Gloeomargarita sp. SKYB120]MDW8179203.1 DUF2949 domain-containing protein [Gloeomargarita sp. SKYBB_i_bin120]